MPPTHPLPCWMQGPLAIAAKRPASAATDKLQQSTAGTTRCACRHSTVYFHLHCTLCTTVDVSCTSLAASSRLASPRAGQPAASTGGDPRQYVQSPHVLVKAMRCATHAQTCIVGFYHTEVFCSSRHCRVHVHTPPSRTTITHHHALTVRCATWQLRRGSCLQ
jgi:hypothetical protein